MNNKLEKIGKETIMAVWDSVLPFAWRGCGKARSNPVWMGHMLTENQSRHQLLNTSQKLIGWSNLHGYHCLYIPGGGGEEKGDHDIGTDLFFRQHSVESSTEKSGSLRRLNSLDKGTGSNSNCVAKPVGDKLIEIEKAETGSVSWWITSFSMFIALLYLCQLCVFINYFVWVLYCKKCNFVGI